MDLWGGLTKGLVVADEWGMKSRFWAPLGLLVLLAACKQPVEKTRGVGGNLHPFVVQNVESGERYCQVCSFSAKPILMSAADLDDEGIEADLLAINSMVTAYQEKGLQAFVVFGKLKDGKLSPVTEDKAANEKLAALKKKLGLAYTVSFIPAKYTDAELKSYTPFVDAYDIVASRTVMFTGVDRKVVYTDVLKGEDAQYKQLEEKIKQTL